MILSGSVIGPLVMSSSLHRLISVNLTSGQVLSRAHKRFNSLLKKIDRQRAELQAWETKEAAFARGWARHVAPFRERQAASVVEVIDLLDELAGRQVLSELDLATLESELCDMVETVLAEGVLDEDECQRLETLFDHYSGVSLQAIHAEEEADFKAQVLDEVGLDLGDEDIDLNDPGALLEQVLRKLEEQDWEAGDQDVTHPSEPHGWPDETVWPSFDVESSGDGSSQPVSAGVESDLTSTPRQGAAGFVSTTSHVPDVRNPSDPAEKAARRNARRRAAAAEKRRQAEEMAQQQASHAVQVVFRHLASVLHPDRETDPAERARKTALMQRVTLAYHANRLVDLLELQLEVAKADMGDMASLSEEQLQSYIRVLKQQSEDLAHELQQREMWLRVRYPLNRFQKAIRPRDLARILREVRAGVKQQLQHLDALKARLATEQGVRAWLKSLRQQAVAQIRVQESMASLVGGLIQHPPEEGF